jgi:hypothetical protein
MSNFTVTDFHLQAEFEKGYLDFLLNNLTFTHFFKTIPRLYLSGKFSFVVTITAYTSIDSLLIAR